MQTEQPDTTLADSGDLTRPLEMTRDLTRPLEWTRDRTRDLTRYLTVLILQALGGATFALLPCEIEVGRGVHGGLGLELGLNNISW